MDREEAAAALAGVERAQQRMAEQIAVCPPWRHAAFGGVMALLNFSLAMPLAVQTGMMVAAMALLVAIVHNDRRRYGVFVNGYRRGRTQLFTFALLAVVLALMAVQISLRRGDPPEWAPAAVALLTFALATLASIQWSRIFRRELAERR